MNTLNPKKKLEPRSLHCTACLDLVPSVQQFPCAVFRWAKKFEVLYKVFIWIRWAGSNEKRRRFNLDFIFRKACRKHMRMRLHMIEDYTDTTTLEKTEGDHTKTFKESDVYTTTFQKSDDYTTTHEKSFNLDQSEFTNLDTTGSRSATSGLVFWLGKLLARNRLWLPLWNCDQLLLYSAGHFRKLVRKSANCGLNVLICGFASRFLTANLLRICGKKIKIYSKSA